MTGCPLPLTYPARSYGVLRGPRNALASLILYEYSMGQVAQYSTESTSDSGTRCHAVLPCLSGEYDCVLGQVTLDLMDHTQLGESMEIVLLVLTKCIRTYI